MAELIYATVASLDGYVEDEEGRFDWAMPDEEVHAFSTISSGRSVPTFTGAGCTRRWCSGRPRAPRPMSAQCSGTMLGPGAGAEKIVYSRALQTVSSARHRIDASSIGRIRRLSVLGADIAVGGAELAGQAIGAGLVDECHLFLCPIVVGGGKRALPDRVRAQLELLDERRFRSGVVHLHYRVSV